MTSLEHHCLLPERVSFGIVTNGGVCTNFGPVSGDLTQWERVHAHAGTVEFADAGSKSGTHDILVVGGCTDASSPGDIGMSLNEAKALLQAIQWEFVAAQAAKTAERARQCAGCGKRLMIKDWKR